MAKKSKGPKKENTPLTEENRHKAEMLIRGTAEGMHAAREVLEAFDDIYFLLGEAQRCLAVVKTPKDRDIWAVIKALQFVQGRLSKHKASYEAERLCRLAALSEAVCCLGKPLDLNRPERPERGVGGTTDFEVPKI